MQRKVMLLAAVGILAIATSAVMAGDPAAKTVKGKEVKAEKAKPVLQDITVTGTVSKVEKANKKTGEKAMVFVLKDDAGVEVNLPKSDKAGVKLEDFVGAKVTVVGKGMKHEGKNGTKIMINKITTIEKADAAAAPAAAAPAATPAEKAVDKAL